MNKLKNDRILKALMREPVDRTPMWIMRQAGRYLPEFRKLRAENPDFIQFCKTPELACEATLQPLARFDLDAAIIFSDILTVVDALGFNLEYIKTVGPVVHNPVRSLKDLQNLSMDAAIEKLSYVSDAVSMTVKALDNRVPLIGFAGSPWTVGCYMVEGQNANHFQTIRTMVYKNPQILHALLQLLTDITVEYINAQIKAGARIIMLFDSWGGVLSSLTYSQFSLNYMQQIGQRVLREFNGNKIPLIFFTKNGGNWLEQTANAGCDAVGLDWTVNLTDARRRVGNKVALQGNLDPLALYGTPDSVHKAVKEILLQYGPGSGHVFNLGHGIDKSTPIENVEALVDTITKAVVPFTQC